MPLAPIEDAIDAIRRGEMVILVDDEERENEGDLVVAADAVTPEAINFMAKFGRGLICLSLTEERLRKLDLPLMVQDNSAQFGTAFTVSIEAREGVTTGISAADRAHTIRVAVDDASGPQDLVRPGHIFPLRARPGGVLVRTGQTEGSVDLSRLAGRKPAAVICEILNEDGTMARMADLESFAAAHGLLICSVADLITYRLQRDRLIERLGSWPFPCRYGEGFELRLYRSLVDGAEHAVLLLGDPREEGEAPLVRVQHGAGVLDAFGGRVADQGWQVDAALREIATAGRGVFVYLQQDLPPLSSLLAQGGELAPKGQDKEQAINTVPPVFRNLGIGSQILVDCGVSRMRLLTSSGRRLVGVEAYGLEIEDMVHIRP